jgi:hypothetical protein
VRRLASTSVAAALLSWLAPIGVAHATEGETDVGATAGVTFLDTRSKGVHLGAGGTILARHGLTDAFDLAAELSLSLQPSIATNLYGAAGGFHYVVDVARFRPHIGLLVGATDVSTTSCPERPSNIEGVEEARPPLFPCRDEILPTGILPIGVDWAPDDPPIRIGFSSRVAMLPFRDGVPDVLFHVTLGAGFTWIFDADPASR